MSQIETEGVGTYRLKAIRFGQREVPIVLQGENGPCPLIALANILLLTGRLKISVEYTEVTHEYLIQAVANHLMELKEPSDKKMHADWEAHLQEAIALLPSLKNGLDVNVRFTGCDQFEYTKECVVFDLLNIDLLHGWLVEQEDEAMVKAVGNMTYNQVVEKMVFGNEVSQWLEEEDRRGQTVTGGARAELLEGEELLVDLGVVKPRPQQTQAQGQGHRHPVEPQELLDDPFADLDGFGPEETQEEDEIEAEPEEDPWAEFRAQMSGGGEENGEEEERSSRKEEVEDRKVAEPLKKEVREETELVIGKFEEEEQEEEEKNGGGGRGEEENDEEEDEEEFLLESMPAMGEARLGLPTKRNKKLWRENAIAKKNVTEHEKELMAKEAEVRGLAVFEEAYVGEAEEEEEEALGGAGQSAHDVISGMSSEERTEAVLLGKRLELFLAESGNQLTFHGLAQLHERMADNQLAVFFRNNHFSTLCKFRGQLYLLVTDLGYCNERNVVWERFDQVDGDSVFCHANFKTFTATTPELRAQANAKVPVGTRGTLGLDGWPGDGNTEGEGSLGREGSNADEDYALALKLQEQERQAEVERAEARQARAREAERARLEQEDIDRMRRLAEMERKKKKKEEEDGGCVVQ